MDKITFRKATIHKFHDYVRLYNLDEQEYQEKYSATEPAPRLSAKTLKKLFEQKIKNYLLLAYHKNKSIGYLDGDFQKFSKNYKRGYISDIFILKNFRKQGVATQMKDLFLKELKRRKYHELALDVNIKNPAVKLYKSWGLAIIKYRMTKRI